MCHKIWKKYQIYWFKSFRTRTGRMPELMRASIGGFRSEDKSFRAAWTAANWVALSALRAFSTMVSKPRIKDMTKNWTFCCVNVFFFFLHSCQTCISKNWSVCNNNIFVVLTYHFQKAASWIFLFQKICQIRAGHNKKYDIRKTSGLLQGWFFVL